MPVREKFVRSGDWRTLETFWNVTTTAWFQKPAGAEVKIRYSGWWFGADRQRQRLDGSTVKGWSSAAGRSSLRASRSGLRTTRRSSTSWRPVTSPTCPPEYPSDPPRRSMGREPYQDANRRRSHSGAVYAAGRI